METMKPPYAAQQAAGGSGEGGNPPPSIFKPEIGAKINVISSPYRSTQKQNA